MNKVETEAELTWLRRSVRRGMPFGDAQWTRSSAVRLGLEAATRPRGRPRKETRHVCVFTIEVAAVHEGLTPSRSPTTVTRGGQGSVDLMGSDPLLTVVEAKNVWVLASVAVMKGSDPIKSTCHKISKNLVTARHSLEAMLWA